MGFSRAGAHEKAPPRVTNNEGRRKEEPIRAVAGVTQAECLTEGTLMNDDGQKLHLGKRGQEPM